MRMYIVLAKQCQTDHPVQFQVLFKISQGNRYSPNLGNLRAEASKYCFSKEVNLPGPTIHFGVYGIQVHIGHQGQKDNGRQRKCFFATVNHSYRMELFDLSCAFSVDCCMPDRIRSSQYQNS